MVVSLRTRRRKGWSNRARRAAYALLLWLSHHPLAAAAAPDARPYRQEPLKARISIESILSHVIGADATFRVSVVAQDPRIAPLFSKVAELLRAQTWYLHSERSSLRSGIGLNIELPDDSGMFLKLVPNDDPTGQGVRWELFADADDGQQALKLGGCLDMIGRPEDPRREFDKHDFELTPQLVLDVDDLTGMPGTAQLRLERSGWRTRDHYRVGDDPVWQLTVSWRF